MVLALVLVLPACTSSPTGSAAASSDPVPCRAPEGLARIDGPPFGVVLPSGRFASQSFTSAEAIASAGLTAVSLGIPLYYSDSGEIVFGRRGETSEQWLEQVRCTVLEAKAAGLMTIAWGQFVPADAPPGEEPMGAPEGVRALLGPAVLPIMPALGAVLEEAQVEYFSPVSELDKFVGFDNHNKVFRDLVEAARTTFSGTIYAQPNTLAKPPSFLSEGVIPDLGGADAMSIAWISFGCREDDVAKAQWYVDQALAQGVDEVFIGEIGGVTGGSPTDEQCLRSLVERWDGERAGVVVLDAPSDVPGAAQVAGSWREELLRQWAATAGSATPTPSSMP